MVRFRSTSRRDSHRRIHITNTSSAERNYSAGEEEALACLWACEKWRVCPFVCHFTLKTDHQVFVTLLSTQGSFRQQMRIARWVMRLLKYDYEIHYQKGSENVIVDALSRLPVTNSSDQIKIHDSEEELTCLVRGICPNDLEEAEEETERDTDLPRVIQCINTVWTLEQQRDSALFPLYKVREDLSFLDGLVLRGEVLILPALLRRRPIDLTHESHPGIVRTKQHLWQRS